MKTVEGKIFYEKENGKKRAFIEKLGDKIKYNAGFHSKMLKLIKKDISQFYRGKSCLILGPSGEIENDLSLYFKSVVCVDGSSRVLKKIRRNFPYYTYIHSLFEEMIFSNNKFDTILMINVLEHIDDPIKLLRKIRKYLTIEGRIIIAVPNAFSIHRLLGVEMGLLKNPYELNNFDKRVGHKRIYDFTKLEADIINANLKILCKKGLFVKPFHNAYMNKLSKKQLKGLHKMGENFSRLCAEILVVCKK